MGDTCTVGGLVGNDDSYVTMKRTCVCVCVCVCVCICMLMDKHGEQARAACHHHVLYVTVSPVHIM